MLTFLFEANFWYFLRKISLMAPDRLEDWLFLLTFGGMALSVSLSLARDSSRKLLLSTIC